MAYDTVFFDLDGTLFDAGLSIPKSVQYALAKLGIDVPNLDDLRRFVGPPLEHSFEEYYQLGGSDLSKAVKYYREYFGADGIHEYIIYPGIRELLVKLKIQNVVLAVVTAKVDFMAEQVLRASDVLEYFDFVAARGPEEVVLKKITLKKALNKLGLNSASSVVMVGDMKHDIIAAKENQIDSIGVTYGYGSEEELLNNGATYIANDALELGSLLLT